ncbi:cytochrome P450 [Nocardia sp. ET3-3]|uniref:Cytochrome P450 n=1 Tax=Nocardia terrae TaxID=2675851 RepID=A0A7K1UUX5_9NOCA|nr:cytochrome P450 [Nocardia terrae]MVU77688.1 cytochrome P450 [Nocardia terrae]
MAPERCPFTTGIHDVDALHEELRTRGDGVHQAELPDGSPAWVITGYDAVRRLLADPNVSAAKADSTTGYKGNSLPPALDANLLNMDGEHHRRIRKLAAEAFAPPQYPAQEKVILDTVTELVAQLPATGEVDFMDGLCEPLPVRVTGTLLGLSPDQLGDFRAASAPLLRADDSHEPEALRTSMRTLLGLIGNAIAAKRRDPGQDLLSAWIAARDGDDRLTEDELMSLAFITIVGGFENTISLTSAVLDDVVRDHQPQARELLDRPTEFAAFIRTRIRANSPMNYAVRRFPLTDLEINGVQIPRGHTVFASIRSAHLDPAGKTRPALTFGHGRHRCLGATLAELQTIHATRAVLHKYPTLNAPRPRNSYTLRHSWLTHALAELTLTAT